MTLLQFCTLLIPLLSTVLVGFITYRYAIKSKKFDLLYASKIPAFKEITVKLTNYKAFCHGQVAYYEGNEFSPYYNSSSSTLHHRKEIADVTDLNAIFLSKANRININNLLNNMSILCNIELQNAITSNNKTDYSEIYEQSASEVGLLIEALYKDLNME